MTTTLLLSEKKVPQGECPTSRDTTRIRYQLRTGLGLSRAGARGATTYEAELFLTVIWAHEENGRDKPVRPYHLLSLDPKERNNPFSDVDNCALTGVGFSFEEALGDLSRKIDRLHRGLQALLFEPEADLGSLSVPLFIERRNEKS